VSYSYATIPLAQAPPPKRRACTNVLLRCEVLKMCYTTPLDIHNYTYAYIAGGCAYYCTMHN